MHRKKFGLRQKDLAEQFGVSADTVRNWELGHTKPMLQNLQKIAEVVRVPKRFLLPAEANWPNRLRLARRRLGLSQGDFGTRMGVSRDTVWNWENGNHEPTDETRERVDQIIEDTLHGGESVAARMWELRMQLGLSQRELAERLGVVHETVSRWERGTRRPSEEMVEKIRAM